MFWYVVRNAEEADRDKFWAELWRPPVVPRALRAVQPTEPIPPQSPWSAESEQRAFAALKSGLGA